MTTSKTRKVIEDYGGEVAHAHVIEETDGLFETELINVVENVISHITLATCFSSELGRIP